VDVVTRRVIVVERAYRHPDRPLEWSVWGVWDSIGAVRREFVERRIDVPTSHNRWRRYPWQWADEHADYRADQTPLRNGSW